MVMQRLWLYDTLVGYRRMEGSIWFYSKDLMWWNGAAIEFDRMDAGLELKDRNNRRLFEKDILLVENGEKRAPVRLLIQDNYWSMQNLHSGQIIRVQDLHFTSLEFKAIGSGNLQMDCLLYQSIEKGPELTKTRKMA
jgi:hypothetical protein